MKTVYINKGGIMQYQDSIGRAIRRKIQQELKCNKSKGTTKLDVDISRVAATSMFGLSVSNGLLHLKSIHPLWKILKKCIPAGV